MRAPVERDRRTATGRTGAYHRPLGRAPTDGQPPHVRHRLQLGAFFLFATMDTAAKWLAAAAIPAIQVAFVRYAVHLGWALALYLPAAGRGGVPLGDAAPAGAARGLAPRSRRC